MAGWAVRRSAHRHGASRQGNGRTDRAVQQSARGRRRARPRLRRAAAGVDHRRGRLRDHRLRHQTPPRSRHCAGASRTSATSRRRAWRSSSAASRRRRASPACIRAPTTPILARCDGILICVPTPLTENREPDLSYVVDTAETVARHLRRGQLVVLESTTYPGTTDEVVRPILERSGLRAGRDFHLAFSPEREDPNNRDFTTRTIPKLVGGITPECGHVAAALYGTVIERVVPVSQRQRRRGRQAAREHLPQRQHRPGQRAQGALRSHGAQRLGGHRRRRDEAVRLHAVLSRGRAWAAIASRSTPST